MIATYLRQAVRDWNYGLLSPAVRVLGWVAMSGHLLFYLILYLSTSHVESPGARLLVMALFSPLVVYPTRDWRLYHKIYYELMMAICMPGFFTYMLLLNDTNLYWSASLIFSVLLYGAFVKPWTAICLYPMAVAGAVGVFHLLHPERVLLLQAPLEIQFICVLVLVIVLICMVYAEREHFELADLKKHADQQNEVFSALLDISVEVSRYDDLEEIFPLILQRFETIYPDRGFGLLIEGPRPKIILCMAFRSIGAKDASFLLKVHPYVMGFTNVYPENDQEQLSSLDGQEWHVFGGGIRSTSIQGEMVYCFKLFIKGEGFNEHEHQTLQVFLELIRGIARSRIQAMELERYSNTDQLTGLYNRNYFTHIVAQWQKKAHPEKPYAVIFSDINELKRINDTYGHRAGDVMITACADLLKDIVRKSDMVFRHGGDEIVILCPATTLQDAQELVERIHGKANNLVVLCEDEMTGEQQEEMVHISFGVACSNEPDVTDVTGLADQRMFENKERWYKERGNGKYR